MECVYRLRPINDKTIEELQNNYLWFSKRCGFKDVEDANVGAFMCDTPQIQKGFELFLNEKGLADFIRLMDDVGICCFTKDLPQDNELKEFPNGNKSLCIEYNKAVLEDFFFNEIYAMHNPFKEVEYAEKPTIIKTDGEYHIMTKNIPGGEVYESIYTLFNDPKRIDELVWLLLTRLNIKFYKQKELRIIIGGRNLGNVEDQGTGYNVQIPEGAISRVFLYKDPGEDFFHQLLNIPILQKKLVKLY